MGVSNPNERAARTPKVKVAPEATRPVTPKQKQAINRGVTKAGEQQAAKVALKTAKAISGQRLKPVHANLIDHVLSDVGNAALHTPHAVENYAQKLAGVQHGREGTQKLRKTLSTLSTNSLQQGRAQGKEENQTALAVADLVSHPKRNLLHLAQSNQKEQQSGFGLDQAVRAVPKIAQATAKHPGKVLGATVKSVPGAVEGLVAGPVYAASDPAGAYKGIKQDYNTRYGKDAGKAVQKEGLLPYALDAATAVTGVGKLAGLGAEAGALGKAGKAAMADRPKLRVSPNRAVEQPGRSGNLFKAVAQNIADTSREKATLKRQNKGAPRGIEPQGPNEVVPRSKHVANKKLERSFGVRSGMNRNLHAQARQELRTFFEKHVPKTLSKDQIERGAFRYAVEHGIRTPEQAAKYLPKLKSLIQENRTKAPLHDELPQVQWLIDHPHVFDAKLGEVADQARELGARLGAEDPRLKPKQQRERSVTPQGFLLGHGPRLKGERVKTYEARVAEARNEAGLAAPGYFPHRDLLKPKFVDYVRGSGVHGAVGGHKETSYTLMKEGAAVVHPQALSDALARNLKNQFNVNHVADTVATFAQRRLVDKTTGEAIHLDPAKTTYHDLEKALERAGVKDLVPYRPNTIYKAMRDQTEHPGDANKFLSDAYTMAKDPTAFHNSKGWVLIPKEIDRQMRDSFKHNGFISRLFAKNKAFSTAVVLGQNPSWPMMRVIHNLGSSAIFNVNPAKGAAAVRDLSPAQLKRMDAYVGSDAFAFDHSPPRMGAAATPEGFTDTLRAVALSDTKVGKAIRSANPAEWARQLARPAMAAERHQMAYFRRSAAYQKLSKDAKLKVNQDVTGLVKTVAGARDELLKDPNYLEDLAHHVNEIFGDFTHYSGIQRSLMQNLMFYGFLRYATRIVLKDLPLKHPIKANILLNLSRQNERHTRDVLGLGPNDPLPFGADANVYSRDKKGNLSVQSLHRANPLGAVSLESLDDPRRLATSSLPYGTSEIATQLTNADLLRRHGLRVGGSATEKGFGDHISVEDRARVALADLLKMSAPYRVTDNIGAAGRKMGNDSLAFSPRPILHKQTQAITNDLLAEKFGKDNGAARELLRAELPFVKIPSRDDVLALQVKQAQERLSGKHLTPKQKQAEEKKLRSQPGYQKAFRQAQVLSKQRSKHRGRHASTKPFSIDDALSGGTNAIDSILP